MGVRAHFVPAHAMTPPAKRCTTHTIRELRTRTHLGLLGSLYWPLGVLTYKWDAIDFVMTVLVDGLPAVLITKDLINLRYNLAVYPAELERYSDRRRQAEIRQWRKENPHAKLW